MHYKSPQEHSLIPLSNGVLALVLLNPPGFAAPPLGTVRRHGGGPSRACLCLCVCVVTLWQDYFCENIMVDGYRFSTSGLYHTISCDPEAPHKT